MVRHRNKFEKRLRVNGAPVVCVVSEGGTMGTGKHASRTYRTRIASLVRARIVVAVLAVSPLSAAAAAIGNHRAVAITEAGEAVLRDDGAALERLIGLVNIDPQQRQ